MNGSAEDNYVSLLATMPRIEANPVRVEQIRSRCRTMLERRSVPTPMVEPMAVGALCSLYVWQILRVVMR
jgi:hypothetical protein